MASTSYNPPPLPKKIIYPPNEELTYLFSKKLTASDMKYGIKFNEDANDFIRDNVSESFQIRIMKYGYTAKLYAPNVCEFQSVTIEEEIRMYDPLRIPCYQISMSNGWAEELGLKSGSEIRCWCLYKPEEGDRFEELSILIEEVKQI